MVRRIFSVFVSSFLLAILPSCEEPLELDDLPAVQPKLVVISNFSEGKAIVVTVASSRLIGAVDQEEYLTDAEVNLYRENTLLERLKLVVPDHPDQPPYYLSLDHTPIADIEYTIRVLVDGYQPVMAKSSVPASIEITRFDLYKIITEPIQHGLAERHRFSAVVDFDDPLIAGNYYYLNITQQINNFVVEGKDTLITKSSLQKSVFNPLDNENGISAHLSGGLLFEDKPKGKALDILFSVDIDPAKQLLGKTYVELRTLSEEYYLYYTSLSRSGNANPNPLTDPVIVFENIENGYGIFAGYSNSLDSVQIAQ